jgi:hydroxymethylpyrimidine/phosphomethylpyrimidine kinase
MQAERKYVLSIAGFDPTSGAGLTADIKTFEQMGLYGLAVCTAHTLQTHDTFYSVNWRSLEEVKRETILLLNHYEIKAVKFGIVPSFLFLNEMVAIIKQHNKTIKIVVDPVWKSGSGFTINSDQKPESHFLQQIDLLTPNLHELEHLGNGDTKTFLSLTRAITNVLVKGGHSETQTGQDTLYTAESTFVFKAQKKDCFPKHGSGCVLSAAITAQLANGATVEEACKHAKTYIERFLSSNPTLLGYHVV